MLGAQTLGGGSQSPISMEAQLPLNGMSLGKSELQVALGRKDKPWASQAFSLQPGTVPMGAASPRLGDSRILNRERSLKGIAPKGSENRSRPLARLRQRG